TLKNYENQLAPYGFMRVHKSWLINMDYVKGFDKREGGYAIMQDESKIPVSPNKRNDFFAQLGN
ncbi:MAG: LytTR family DNA-binding domain-containing protein, partial [Bacteroidota bacterium]